MTKSKFFDKIKDAKIERTVEDVYNEGINLYFPVDKFEIDENFNFKPVADKINDLSDIIQRYARVTEHNLSKIFDYFCKNVLKGNTKLNGHDLVEIFMGVIGDKMNYFQHPSNPNVLVCNGRNVNMDGNAFKYFFGYFDRNYTPQDTMCLNGIADRLIEDADRRLKGDFWTPTVFVDYAHKMMENAVGMNWRDTFVVWDNCWGTGNLTRDYMFNELYCSTLYQSELNIGSEYNKEAVKFQFDFLNDDIPMPNDLVKNPTKLPQGLVDALQQNKPIVFFINPPYGTANNLGVNSGHKAGIAKTIINQQMLSDDFGACSENLYAQFLYRIMQLQQKYNLTNCYIGLYSPTLFLTGTSWKKFRKKFLNTFSFINGCQFCANQFSDVADSWAISFSIWKNGITADKENFNYDLVDVIDGEVQVIGTKNVYNIDFHTSSSDWVKESVKNIKTSDFPQLSSAIKWKEGKGCCGSIVLGALGYYVNVANNIYKSQTDCFLLTSTSSMGHGVSICDSNYERVCANFSARKLIKPTWYNQKDEYLAPNENHTLYDEFVNDSIVYSLFNSASNQSSLRDVDYKGKKWNICNEFFWMGKNEIESLANTNGFTQTYNEARTSKDRYVYSKLQTITLSTEAQAVLDKASDIVRNTFRYRSLLDGIHPEYQIMNWDCGWYQIKALAKEYDKSEYEEFVKLYKALENKMRPMVYTLDFLK